MSEEKKAPASIVLGSLDDEEETPQTVDLGIGESVPMATTELEDDEDIAEFADSFSGSISPKGSETADSKQTEPEAGKMKKKDFWLGVFAPVGLLILVSIIYYWLDGVSHYEYEEPLKGVNLYGDSGNFTIDTLGFGVDCNEDTYNFRIYYYDVYGNVIDLRDGDYYGSSFDFSCGEEWTIAQSDFVGYWEANGTLNLSLPYAPENGAEIIVGWNNSANTTSIGTGDGVRTNFSVDAGERHGGPFDEWTFIGKYERQPVENGWHEVSVYETSEGLWWHNEADEYWRLYWWPDSFWGPPNENRSWHPNSCENHRSSEQRSGSLWTGEESVYGEQVLIYNGNSFDGLCFNGEFYTLIEGVEMGAGYDHCSELTVELVDEEGNQTDYWNGGEFGSCYSNMDNPESPESVDDEAWSLILSTDVELVRNFGKDGPMSFQLPSDHEDIDRIEISAYSESIAQEKQDGQREAQELENSLEDWLTFALILSVPAILIAAFATGHKWFAYGFLTGSTVPPMILVIVFGPFIIFLFAGL